MKTLKDAKVGDTVIVAKLHGEGAVKRPHYGYGDHQGSGDPHPERSPRWGTLWS